MTTLNDDQNYTIGELYRPAMQIKDAAEAREYFAELVRWHSKKWGKTESESIATMKSNLGYFAGYYDSETRQRVETLFECSHPIFGSVAENGTPSAETAFAKGVELANQ